MMSRRFWRAVFVAAIAFLLWLAAACIYDAVLPVVSSAGCPKSKVVVVDAEGLVRSVNAAVIKGLSIARFLALGKCDARYLIIVSHGLRVVSSVFIPKDSFALETSESASPLSPLLYPLFVITEGVVEGRSFGSSSLKLAVTERIVPFMQPLHGKVLILVTCPMGNVTRFAKALISRGSIMVAYPRFDVFEGNVSYVVSRIVSIVDKCRSLRSLASDLSSLGFKVVER